MPRPTNEAPLCRASRIPPPGRADRRRARRRPKRRGGRVSARVQEALRSHCRRPDVRRWRPVPPARPTRAEGRFSRPRLPPRPGVGDGEDRASATDPAGERPAARQRSAVAVRIADGLDDPWDSGRFGEGGHQEPLDRRARRASAPRSYTIGGARLRLLARPLRGARRLPPWEATRRARSPRSSSTPGTRSCRDDEHG